MHANRTFSLDICTIQMLNDRVRASMRSKFVDRAIQDRTVRGSQINAYSIIQRHFRANKACISTRIRNRCGGLFMKWIQTCIACDGERYNCNCEGEEE